MPKKRRPGRGAKAPRRLARLSRPGRCNQMRLSRPGLASPGRLSRPGRKVGRRVRGEGCAISLNSRIGRHTIIQIPV